MRFLLDTRTFLWWINAETSRLSRTAIQLIADPNNELFLSAASGWEIAIKAQIGKLRVDSPLEHFFAEQLALNNIVALPITLIHALHIHQLPLIHRDPFDRIIIVQSQLERLPIMSSDSIFDDYDVEVVW